MIDSEHRYPRTKDAMYCIMYEVPNEKYPSLCQIECHLEEYTECPSYDCLVGEEELTVNDDYISFHWYETLPSCSIHCMLPKYPPEVPRVKTVLTKSCQECDDLFNADLDYVPCKFRKKEHLVHHTKPFQIFFEKYYLVTMTRYKYYYFLRIILSKQNVEDVCLLNLLVREMMS